MQFHQAKLEDPTINSLNELLLRTKEFMRHVLQLRKSQKFRLNLNYQSLEICQ